MPKDVISRQIHLAQYDCMNSLLFFPMERKMIEMREKLQNDPEEKKKYEERREKLKKKKPDFNYMRINPDGSIGNNIFLILNI